MKLTKDQRYTAYCIMLEEIDDFVFFCWGMKIFRLPDNEKILEKHFPELFAYKPTKCYSYRQWFIGCDSGVKLRKQILKKCIEETSNF